ncbi:MAG: protein kinase [Holophagales bacterium]|nr:protein kinase [Holophagales bacterium]
MSLSPGFRLGGYEITGKLGEGGMGVVYRATDSKLKREVAIKVLPEAFAADADRLARFEREAQVLAQLQHANIASIYGLEESGGVRALVMELVEGEDLAERPVARLRFRRDRPAGGLRHALPRAGTLLARLDRRGTLPGMARRRAGDRLFRARRPLPRRSGQPGGRHLPGRGRDRALPVDAADP